MGVVLAFPILFILIILQTTLVGQMTLLSGCADLILLWLVAWSLQKQVKYVWVWTGIAAVSIAFISAQPWYIPVIGYSAITLFSKYISKRIWQSPLLMMFLATIFGSVLMNGLTNIALIINNISIPLRTGLVQVIIPSTLINLLIALPVYSIVKNTAQWLYPLEVAE